MNDENSFMQQNAGWLVAAVTAVWGTLTTVWGFILKVIIGRHYVIMDKLVEELHSIDVRLARVEGALRQGKHNE